MSTRIGPADVERLIRLHRELYGSEYGYDREFEAYVADGLENALSTFKAKSGKLWLAKVQGELIGSIAIVGHSRTSAQLRWFLVRPEHRGRGLGGLLLKKALDFARAAGFRRVFLWTTSELAAARHLYLGAGFRKTRERTHAIWGRGNVTEERYELRWIPAKD